MLRGEVRVSAWALGEILFSSSGAPVNTRKRAVSLTAAVHMQHALYTYLLILPPELKGEPS